MTETDVLVALTHIRDALALLAVTLRIAVDFGFGAAAYVFMRGHL